MIIDATSSIVGRLSAYASKKLLNGEEVAIVNAEKAVISGDAVKITARYKARRGMRYMANPEKSAKWPRRPDMFLKKIISGMLPKHSSRGAAALKRLKTYIGTPKQFESQKCEKMPKTADKLSGKSISIEKICANLGWENKAKQ